MTKATLTFTLERISNDYIHIKPFIQMQRDPFTLRIPSWADDDWGGESISIPS